jgi:hypothetical protein
LLDFTLNSTEVAGEVVQLDHLAKFFKWPRVLLMREVLQAVEHPCRDVKGHWSRADFTRAFERYLPVCLRGTICLSRAKPQVLHHIDRDGEVLLPSGSGARSSIERERGSDPNFHFWEGCALACEEAIAS